MIEKARIGKFMRRLFDAGKTTLSIKKMRFEPKKPRKRIFLLTYTKKILQKGAQAPFSFLHTILYL